VRALILDSGLDRGSLAAARALQADGWTVAVGSPIRGLAGSSRAVSAWHPVPIPAAGGESFIAAVAEIVAREAYEVVFSSDDQGVLLLSEHRDALRALVPYASHESVLGAFDKLTLTRSAAAVGLAVPRTEDATEETLGAWSGPAVVKPRLTFAAERASRIDVEVVQSAAQVRAQASAVRLAGGEPIVQEVIDGTLMALSVVCDRESSIVAAVQQESPHTWPPRVGVSARARTVSLEEPLRQGVQELLRKLGWFGLAQLQFLRPADGEPRLLELNGRFYGSLALAVRSGVNLPSIWARLATGHDPAPIAEARVGQSYQWLSRDLRASLREADGNPAAAIAAVGGALGHALTSVHSVWSLSDPVPALRHYGGKLIPWTRPRS
jgi:predicted ATP-grasp superfamily ATP-dependent carboligase